VSNTLASRRAALAAICAIGLQFALGGRAAAETPAGAPTRTGWSSLDAEEQKLLGRYSGRWDSLPVEQQLVAIQYPADFRQRFFLHRLAVAVLALMRQIALAHHFLEHGTQGGIQRRRMPLVGLVEPDFFPRLRVIRQGFAACRDSQQAIAGPAAD